MIYEVNYELLGTAGKFDVKSGKSEGLRGFCAIRFEIENDELSAKVQDGCEIQVMRKGRTRRVHAGQSIRLLTGDQILSGDTMLNLTGLMRDKPSISARIRKAGCSILMTTAAALALSGCDEKDVDHEPLTGDAAPVCAYTSSAKDMCDCCSDVKNQDLQKQCIELFKEQYPEGSCEISTGILAGDEPPTPYDLCNAKESADEMCDCCKALDNEDDQNACIDAFKEKYPEGTCQIGAEILTGDVRPPYEACNAKESDDEMCDCCKALDNEDDQNSCAASFKIKYPGESCSIKADAEIPPQPENPTA